MAELTEGTAGAIALAGSAISGFFQGMTQAELMRGQLHIQRIQQRLNEQMADLAFQRSISSLHEAQSDMKAQATKELEDERKAFLSRQAALKVFQAERGIEGDSADQTHMDLLRSHHAWKQTRMENVHRQEREFEFKKAALKDQYISKKYSTLYTPSDPNPWMYGVTGMLDGYFNGLRAYGSFINWEGGSLDVDVPDTPGVD
jgi:hypothetical protein